MVAQPCRLPYTPVGTETLTFYIITADHAEIASAGVVSVLRLAAGLKRTAKPIRAAA